MIKNKISIVISNTKLNMSSFKISQDVIERFFMSTIDNKYAGSTPIL